MTYGVGLIVNGGLVVIADTRTNAGLDNVATFRKLHTFEDPGRKAIAIATAGNLAITQSVVSHLMEGLHNPATGQTERLLDQETMFEAVQFVGRAVRHVFQRDELDPHGPNGFDVSLLVGGQFADRRLRLFMVYSAGNFIEATEETPYLQIGEHKYGKPILDRSIRASTNLSDALKLGLISMDSTIRSNLGVGMPIDIAILPRNESRFTLNQRIEQGDAYFHDLRERWSAALRAAHQAIPQPPYPTGDQID